MILVWKYEFLWICLILYGEKNQTINPILMNMGLKEPYLVYWLFFGCNAQVFFLKGNLGNS